MFSHRHNSVVPYTVHTTAMGALPLSPCLFVSFHSLSVSLFSMFAWSALVCSCFVQFETNFILLFFRWNERKENCFLRTNDKINRVRAHHIYTDTRGTRYKKEKTIHANAIDGRRHRSSVHVPMFQLEPIGLMRHFIDFWINLQILGWTDRWDEAMTLRQLQISVFLLFTSSTRRRLDCKLHSSLFFFSVIKCAAGKMSDVIRRHTMCNACCVVKSIARKCRMHVVCLNLTASNRFSCGKLSTQHNSCGNKTKNCDTSRLWLDVRHVYPTNVCLISWKRFVLVNQWVDCSRISTSRSRQSNNINIIIVTVLRRHWCQCQCNGCIRVQAEPSNIKSQNIRFQRA